MKKRKRDGGWEKKKNCLNIEKMWYSNMIFKYNKKDK